MALNGIDAWCQHAERCMIIIIGSNKKNERKSNAWDITYREDKEECVHSLGNTDSALKEENSERKTGERHVIVM